MSTYSHNGFVGGTGKSAFAARMDHTHDAENQAASTAADAAALKADFNSLLIKLKNAGLMTPDAFTMVYAKSVAKSTHNQYQKRNSNINAISSVVIDNTAHTITITLNKKVSALEDIDGGPAWGVHKWVDIGLSVGVSPITNLVYNGGAITQEDIDDATGFTLSAGYFNRAVAADLVVAGDESQRTKSVFTLWADGYAKTAYQLKVVEPA